MEEKHKKGDGVNGKGHKEKVMVMMATRPQSA
jgi:hypothetical protein